MERSFHLKLIACQLAFAGDQSVGDFDEAVAPFFRSDEGRFVRQSRQKVFDVRYRKGIFEEFKHRLVVRRIAAKGERFV